jgi:arylformamidase
METHHALYRNGIHILENIMLDDVEEGNYELIALPLPIKEADGSPVRAVIRPI